VLRNCYHSIHINVVLLRVAVLRVVVVVRVAVAVRVVVAVHVAVLVRVAAVVSVADGAEPQVSVDIALAFDVLVPVSVVVIEVDSPGRPKFRVLPNNDLFASPSSSVEVVGKESVHSSTDVRTNYGLCSTLSNLGLYQNKNLEHCYNKPTPRCNNVTDTRHLPMGATTSRSRKRGLQ
jgi:hypothetical protein